MSSRPRSCLAGIGLVLSLLVPGLIHHSLAAPAAAQTSEQVRSKRMLRDITVLEKIIDEMLLDSRNLLIYSAGGVTHGLYIDEFGALFSFEASLVDRDEETPWPDGMEGYSFDTDENGNVIIRRTKPPKGKGPETPTPPTPPKPGETPKATPAPRAWIDREAGKQARLYETGKAEIIDTLIEYGDSMDGLRDNQWLCFAAFLKNSDFFLENRISRLVIKAKMSDLRSYAQGRIDRKAMVAKVVQEEY